MFASRQQEEKEQIRADKLVPVDRCCVRGQSDKARLQDANSLLQRLLCTMLFVRLFDGSQGQQCWCHATDLDGHIDVYIVNSRTMNLRSQSLNNYAKPRVR